MIFLDTHDSLYFKVIWRVEGCFFAERSLSQEVCGGTLFTPLFCFPSAVYILARGCFIAVLVVLGKTAIALSIFIRTFETRTIGKDFDALAVFQTSLELSFVAVAVGRTQDAFAIHQSIGPFAFVFVAGLRLVDTLTIGLVVLPLALIGGFAFPIESTLSGLLAIDESTYILIAIREGEGTFTRALPVGVGSFVDITILLRGK